MVTDEPSQKSAATGNRLVRESNGAAGEIAAIEELLRSGHPDIQGLCLALADWSAELRLLHNEERRPAETERRGG